MAIFKEINKTQLVMKATSELKKKRKKKNLSLRDLAEMVNVSHTYINKIEAGNVFISKTLAKSIDKVLR